MTQPKPPDAYDTEVYMYTDDGDPGGSSGKITFYEPDHYDNMYYVVEFSAHGERLALWDFRHDGYSADALLVTYDRSGHQVDWDEFVSKGRENFYNLGTPDGSGNIPEGYKLTIWLRYTDGYGGTTGEWSPPLHVTA